MNTKLVVKSQSQSQSQNHLFQIDQEGTFERQSKYNNINNVCLSVSPLVKLFARSKFNVDLFIHRNIPPGLLRVGSCELFLDTLTKVLTRVLTHTLNYVRRAGGRHWRRRARQWPPAPRFPRFDSPLCAMLRCCRCVWLQPVIFIGIHCLTLVEMGSTKIYFSIWKDACYDFFYIPLHNLVSVEMMGPSRTDADPELQNAFQITGAQARKTGVGTGISCHYWCKLSARAPLSIKGFDEELDACNYTSRAKGSWPAFRDTRNATVAASCRRLVEFLVK
ncbi:hypothetical protein SFRURICE_001533 [Spodoptera frugiperda]|nr:hypothetical protein SFRURICE_001533 [Spodoptera frugiperda]